MALQLMFEVVEHYDDSLPEIFGGHYGPHDIDLDDEIRLRYPDGRDAYTVRVTGRHGLVLHVVSAVEA